MPRPIEHPDEKTSGLSTRLPDMAAGTEAMEAAGFEFHASGAINEDYGCIGEHRVPGREPEARRADNHDFGMTEIVQVLKQADDILRRYPWPVLFIGFAAGYVLSRRGR